MALKLVTAAEPIVSLVQAKRHCRVDHDDDNSYLESLIAAATGWIDGKDGWLGRSLGTQTWDYILDEFPSGSAPLGGGIRLPLPPLQSVTYVRYVDPDTGLEVTLTVDSDYTVDLFSEPGWVMPGEDGWPEPMETVNAVRIRFVSGYETVPASIKHAVLLLVGEWYEAREAASEIKREALPFAVNALLTTYRNWI